MEFWRFCLGASALLVASCAADGVNSNRNLAADTADLPKTDIFVATLSPGELMPQVGDIRVAVNMPGYDNQPSFLPGEAAFLFVSEGQSGSTDIWRYDIGEGARARIHHSPTVSEYSPQAAPGGQHVSYIQENETREITHVHRAPISGAAGEAVVDFASLGYYAWLGDERTIAVYVRGDVPGLHLVDVESGATREIYRNIGRSLHATKDGSALFFTAIGESDHHVIKRYDVASDSVEDMEILPHDGPDFAPHFDADGALRGFFTGSRTRVDYMSVAPRTSWTTVAIVSESYGGVSRIAISDAGDWITFVAEPD